MKDFAYVSAQDVATAVRAIAEPGAKFLGGGTNLVDLMRQNIERPDTVIDITRLPLDRVEELPDGGVRIGALVRNSHLAAHRVIRTRYPMLAQAILTGASGQLRNMATVGGNVLQRTRCPYFADLAARCNKREPGAGCDAIGGFNRNAAIFGASDSCVATHPSDMCVALAALDATIELESVRGVRRLPLVGFHMLPGDSPQHETAIAADELITAIELPELPVAARSRYRKVRDRASYAFALVSVAAALEVRDGVITEARLALGGVAARPWRAHAAERALMGGPATEERFRLAADAELEGAVAQSQNAFKIELAGRAITATLRQLQVEGSAA
ncbi:xanthine dehydrogenase family protein subunit M [Acrocarpospora macrocephala]|uniref:Carbon-monoxide dehydrogenase medium subunit n=1 Tax=Acrocarpospora macrocephala TaxID=150177 RepID=A0A5M3WUH2_9ACTN|nr:xanthine dehydrogenase family protein subunit M [Acrocarpospora macrocephala]GES12176.1 carbon-monoxide dehydrogenase medium subunit [Acrocarpospora macrocephala]